MDSVDLVDSGGRAKMTFVSTKSTTSIKSELGLHGCAARLTAFFAQFYTLNLDPHPRPGSEDDPQIPRRAGRLSL